MRYYLTLVRLSKSGKISVGEYVEKLNILDDSLWDG